MDDRSKTLIQTYVFTEQGAFFVSTIDRPSSAAAAYGRCYAETLVWEWDAEKRERGQIVGQGEAGQGSIYRHQQIVANLWSYGSVDPEYADKAQGVA